MVFASKSRALFRTLGAAVLVVTALAGQTHASTILIDKTFDGVANDIGPAFQQIWNGTNGTGGSSNTTTGNITTGTGSINAAYGFNNVSTIDIAALAPSATGFIVTFEIGAVSFNNMSTAPANGVFFGIVSGASANATNSAGLYNATGPASFGFVAGSANHGDHVMFQKEAGVAAATANTTWSLPNPGDASYQDGFTISVGLFDDNTWTITSTGLSTNLSQNGTLDTINRFSYADIVNSVGVYTSIQWGAQTMDVDRLTLVAVPEPGAVALIVSGASLLGYRLGRRRRPTGTSTR